MARQLLNIFTKPAGSGQGNEEMRVKKRSILKIVGGLLFAADPVNIVFGPCIVGDKFQRSGHNRQEHFLVPAEAAG